LPIYDFKCEKCGHTFSVLTSFQERDQVVCPQCRSKDVRQLISACAVRTKGGGCSTGSAGAGSGSGAWRGG